MGSHLTRKVPEGQPADKLSYVPEKSPCTLAEPTGGVDQRFDGGFGFLSLDKKVQKGLFTPTFFKLMSFLVSSFNDLPNQ